jgi:hypothetical protein
MVSLLMSGIFGDGATSEEKILTIYFEKLLVVEIKFFR